MEIKELYEIAEKENIKVCKCRLKYTKSFSLINKSGNSFIIMGCDCFKTKEEEKVALAHELGHIVSGNLYNRYATKRERKYCENIANTIAVHILVPLYKLKEVLTNNLYKVCDLANIFGVTKKFMRIALRVYGRKLIKLT